MFYYNKNLSFLVVMVPIYVGGVWYLVSGYASLEVLGVLQTCVIPLLVTSRVSGTFRSSWAVGNDHQNTGH